MSKQTVVTLNELECNFLVFSKLGITLCGACLLGGVFLLGMATSESLSILDGGFEKMRHSWVVISGYISFACLSLLFAILGILEMRNLLLTPAGTREFKITRMEEGGHDENSSKDENYVFDIDNNQYRVCHKLFQLLEEKDIIKAEVKRMRIIKINYIHRMSQ
jgi:hypothetical protein